MDVVAVFVQVVAINWGEIEQKNLQKEYSPEALLVSVMLAAKLVEEIGHMVPTAEWWEIHIVVGVQDLKWVERVQDVEGVQVEKKLQEL